MAATLLDGHRYWRLSRDENHIREFTVKHLVKVDIGDGPKLALDCPGLPQAGDIWAFDNDVDSFATCRANAEVDPYPNDEEGDPDQYFLVTQTFSTALINRCGTIEGIDPLLEPEVVTGGFTKFTKEAVYDRFGEFVANSAFEQLRGPQVEFDANRPTVKITANVANLEFELFSSFVDTVNSVPMWGFETRQVKLSNVSWEKKYNGICATFYTRTFEFEIKVGQDTWDRSVIDEGTKVLHGHWGADRTWNLDPINANAPDPLNPAHFDRFRDPNGNPCRVLLNGAGVPATSDDDVGLINIQYYGESDFFLLGIPIDF